MFTGIVCNCHTLMCEMKLMPDVIFCQAYLSEPNRIEPTSHTSVYGQRLTRLNVSTITRYFLIPCGTLTNS